MFLRNQNKLIPVFIIVGTLAAGYFVAAKTQNWWPFQIKNEKVKSKNEICIQVITPARNPKTGEVKDFSTPCDVPEGWEKVEPETIDETANWQTYRNEEFGFELKYPADEFERWTFRDSDGRGLYYEFEMPHRLHNPSNGYWRRVHILINADKKFFNSAYSYEEIVQDYSIKSGYARTELAGRAAFKNTFPGFNEIAAVQINEQYYIDFLDLTIAIADCPPKFGPGLCVKEDEENKKLFDQILSTFKFTK